MGALNSEMLTSSLLQQIATVLGQGALQAACTGLMLTSIIAKFTLKYYRKEKGNKMWGLC